MPADALLSPGRTVEPSALATAGNAVSSASASRPIHLLAYVHLRNIHDSTGAGRVARQLTEHLEARQDIVLRVLADAGDKARILPLVGQPWTGYRYHTFAADTSRQQARWFALGGPRAERFWPEADIIFCTGESYVPTRKAKLVVTAHDAAYFEPHAHQQNRAFQRQRLKWRFLFRRLAARADLIHTVSSFSAGRLAHFFPALKDRIRVVPNAVTPHFFTAVSPLGQQYLVEQQLAGRPFVLVPGGLHFRKNAELILAAVPPLLERYPDLVIAVVNHSNPIYAERASLLGPRVRMLGFVTDAALHALYTAATVVWFPSRYEGFGLPVLEAMASGAPVVASNASSLPEISGDAALLAEPDTPADHLQHLFALLDTPQLRNDLIARGRARASHFTWERSAAQLAACFHSIL